MSRPEGQERLAATKKAFHENRAGSLRALFARRLHLTCDVLLNYNPNAEVMEIE